MTSAAFEGPIGRAVLIILTLMSAASVGITIDRLLHYRTVRRDSIHFRQRLGTTLHIHNLDDLIAGARRFTNPAALVITCGLVAFRNSTSSSAAVAFEAAKRATQRSARDIRITMSRGLNHLAAIVVTALFVGVFGTCYGMLTGFKGCVGSREFCMAALAYEFSGALISTAWGFVLAIASSSAYRHVQSKLSSIDVEIETASLDLLNYLSRRTRN